MDTIRLAPQVGFEPTTRRLTAGCSTTELLRNYPYSTLERVLRQSIRPLILSQKNQQIVAILIFLLLLGKERTNFV